MLTCENGEDKYFVIENIGFYKRFYVYCFIIICIVIIFDFL